MPRSTAPIGKRLAAEAAQIARHGYDALIVPVKFPLDSFNHVAEVPIRSQDRAFDILVARNTIFKNVEFALTRHDGKVAHYAGLCPRCELNLIEVEAELEPDGRFKDWPLIPNCCLACEDAMDAILEAWMAEKVARAVKRAAKEKAPVAAPQGL